MGKQIRDGPAFSRRSPASGCHSEHSSIRGSAAWPVARLLLIEFAMLARGFLLMSRAGTPNAVLVGCFINQLGAGLLLPTLLVWAMSLLTFDNRGRGAGMVRVS